MSNDTARHLADALAYALRVHVALPVDHDADQRAAAALQRYHESLLPPRKLKRKP